MKKSDETTDKSNNKKHNFLYFIVMSSLIFAACYVIYTQYEYTLELNQKNAELLADIEKQKKMTEKISNQEQYYNSDEYIEKVAREQLSLVKPNEILFVDLNK